MPHTFGERPSWQRESCAGGVFWLVDDGSVLLGALLATSDRQHALTRGKALFSQLSSHNDCFRLTAQQRAQYASLRLGLARAEPG